MAFGTLNADGLTNFEVCDVLGDVPSGVGLDQEGELAFVVVRGDWRIGAHDFFAIDVGSDTDVLADREAEDVIGPGKVETVAL